MKTKKTIEEWKKVKGCSQCGGTKATLFGAWFCCADCGWEIEKERVPKKLDADGNEYECGW